jgi:hypothetical protein
MDEVDLVNRLDFHKQAALDEDVEAQGLFAPEPLIFDHHGFLAGTRKTAKFQRLDEAPFVKGRNQTRPFVAMHLDGRGDDGLISPEAF